MPYEDAALEEEEEDQEALEEEEYQDSDSIPEECRGLIDNHSIDPNLEYPESGDYSGLMTNDELLDPDYPYEQEVQADSTPMMDPPT